VLKCDKTFRDGIGASLEQKGIDRRAPIRTANHRHFFIDEEEEEEEEEDGGGDHHQHMIIHWMGEESLPIEESVYVCILGQFLFLVCFLLNVVSEDPYSGNVHW
jgi:hypothetical protein